MFLLINHSDLLAFELILFIYVLKFKLVGKSTPKYLDEDTFSRAFQKLLTNFADLNRRTYTLPASVYSNLSNSMPVPSLFSKPRLFEYAKLKR